jgi:ubiquinone biosynthesis monooxygenase Coq7
LPAAGEEVKWNFLSEPRILNPPSLDQLLIAADHALRTVFATPVAARANPAAAAGEGADALPEADRPTVAALMRVNHTGEVCAQALYQGQALTTPNARLKSELAHAAREETDHLAWTAERIAELGGRPSLLNPLFYAGSFALGALAGLAGDRWNLGFLAETERQVEQHLEGHIGRVPEADRRTHAILEQMKRDETGHAVFAEQQGAAELPAPVRLGMRLMSRVMTRTAYWL